MGGKKVRNFFNHNLLTFFVNRLFLLKTYLLMSLKDHPHQVSITMSTHHALSKLAKDKASRQRNLDTSPLRISKNRLVSRLLL